MVYDPQWDYKNGRAFPPGKSRPSKNGGKDNPDAAAAWKKGNRRKPGEIVNLPDRGQGGPITTKPGGSKKGTRTLPQAARAVAGAIGKRGR